EAHEVVPEDEAPDLLRDAGRRLAPQRLFALEGVGLHFVEAELKLPALVVEGDDLRRGVGDGVEQRREQQLGAEAAALVADRADLERRWPVRMGALHLVARREFEELIPAPEAAGDPALRRAGALLGPREPVAVTRGIGEAVPQRIGRQAAIDEHER